MTVYDVGTRCLIDNDQQRGDRGSRDTDLTPNADGSVDLTFGPGEPGRQRTGSRRSRGGTGSPTSASTVRSKSYFDRTWKLDDITRA